MPELVLVHHVRNRGPPCLCVRRLRLSVLVSAGPYFPVPHTTSPYLSVLNRAFPHFYVMNCGPCSTNHAPIILRSFTNEFHPC